MKQDKVFVRYKNFSDNQTHNRDREYKKPLTSRKVYAQKSNRPREALRQVIDSFEPLSEVPESIAKLIQALPKFFSKESRHPEKDTNQYINQYVIYNAKKYIESLNHTKNHTVKQDNQSSSDPEWNSDDEIDSNMQSKKIDDSIISKVVEKFGDKLVKKQQILKRHEKEFLQDYFKVKRLQQQQHQNLESSPTAKQNNITAVAPIKVENQNPASEKQLKKTSGIPNALKTNQKSQNIWSEYQQKQVNNFVDMGFMTKVEDNEEEIEAQVVEDDGMFASDSDSNKQKLQDNQEEKVESEEESEEDDIFGDDHPTSIKATYETALPRVQSQKKITQGTVFINHQVFSRIAETVGLFPARCIWIISNQTNKFRVSTEYMDTIYRKEKMNEILPMISLNHSQFVKNEDVETPKGLQILRKYNARRQNNSNNNNNNQKESVRVKYQYKQKGTQAKKR